MNDLLFIAALAVSAVVLRWLAARHQRWLVDDVRKVTAELRALDRASWRAARRAARRRCIRRRRQQGRR